MSENIIYAEKAQPLHQLFRILAMVLISAGVAGITWIMGEHVQNGTLVWWPYSAFILMIAVIFVIEGAFVRAAGR
jgi:hypothetical protein